MAYTGKPVGHDGKEMSDRAWERVHAVIARIEEKRNARLAKEAEQKGA